MLEGDARYADLMETTLYNAVLPGLSLDGEHYFYQNPLADDGHPPPPALVRLRLLPAQRRPPAGLAARLLLQRLRRRRLGAPLRRGRSGRSRLGETGTVRAPPAHALPVGRRVEIEVEGEGEFGLMLRIPAWCEEGARARGERRAGRRADLPRHVRRDPPRLAPGDTVRLNLPMPVRRVEMPPLRRRERGPRRADARAAALLRRAGRQPWRRPARPRPASRRRVLRPASVPELLGGVVVLQRRGRGRPRRTMPGKTASTAPGESSRRTVAPDDATPVTAVALLRVGQPRARARCGSGSVPGDLDCVTGAVSSNLAMDRRS